jgi:hypothetical protein
MPGLTQQDLDILQFYAKEGNRELYWNYLAQKEGADGYGLLALGVVRNDSMPGAVANHFADNRARTDGRILSERDWERFGEDLVRRDLALRTQYAADGRADLALNLPVADVQRAHDGAFREARIDPNAWTPRQLLEAARRQDGEAAAERVWHNMLDGSGLGLGRMGITSWDILIRHNDAELPAARYYGALTGASALAAVDRARTDPDVIGARDFYYAYDRRTGQWSSVTAGGEFGPHTRTVTDPAKITELNDARAVRLESWAQRDDFHPADPNRHRPIARSRFTLAEAGDGQDDAARLADSRSGPQPSTTLSTTMSDHPLYQQALAAITRRDAELGREPDAASRSIAAAGASLAARNGYERIDDIVFNVATDRLAAGERFFVLQGGRDDPAHLRASMPTRDALAMTPEQQTRELAQLEVTRQQARAVYAAPEPQRQQAGPQIA